MTIASGIVTSANFGYSVGKQIVYGYMPADYAVEGTQLEIIYFGEAVRSDRRPRSALRPQDDPPAKLILRFNTKNGGSDYRDAFSWSQSRRPWMYS